MLTMPRPYPREFREDVIRVARNREPGVRLKDVAADVGISESCLINWLATADVEDGIKPGSCREEADPRAGERGRAPGGCVPVPGEPAGK
jgi:transposase-like protein